MWNRFVLLYHLHLYQIRRAFHVLKYAYSAPIFFSNEILARLFPTNMELVCFASLCAYIPNMQGFSCVFNMHKLQFSSLMKFQQGLWVESNVVTLIMLQSKLLQQHDFVGGGTTMPWSGLLFKLSGKKYRLKSPLFVCMLPFLSRVLEMNFDSIFLSGVSLCQCLQFFFNIVLLALRLSQNCLAT